MTGPVGHDGIRVVTRASRPGLALAALALAAGALALACPGRLAAAPPTLVPPAISVTLAPPAFALEDKVLTIPKIGSQPVDVVIMMDTTGSMGPAIAELRNGLADLIARLRVEYTDLWIGLVDHRDYAGTRSTTVPCPYSNLYGSSTDRCIMSITRLTSDLTPTGPLTQAVNALVADGGGDFPECHGTVLETLVEDPVNAIGWRPGSYRLILAITDTYSHDCDFCAIRPGGCPDDVVPPGGEGGNDPGMDGVMGNGTYPQDAPILPVIDHLRGAGLHAPVRLAVVFVRTLDLSGPLPADEIGTPYDPTAPPGAWRLYAERTTGDCRAVDGNGVPQGGVTLAEFTQSFIFEVHSRCQAVTADLSDPAYAAWVTIAGAPLPSVVASDVIPPLSIPFTVRISPPPGTPSGIYAFSLRTYCDGFFLASQTISVTVPGCTPGAPDVAPNSLRVLPVGATAASFLWGTTGTGSWHLHTTPAKTALPLLWQDGASIVGTTTQIPVYDSGSFPPGFYRVYGADGCTGESVP